MSVSRRVLCMLLGLAIACAALTFASTQARAASAASWMFDNDRVVEIDFGDVLPEEIETLEAEPDEYVSASFELAIDGVTQGAEIDEVGLRLKGGAGSFRAIGEKPGFKVKFDEYIDDERYFALERLTLNNMVQDASMLHEALTYELIQEMGLKGPRTGYALVRLNGEVLGVYANIESMDEHWLPEHFASTQHLYEADAPGTDVTPGDVFEVDEGDEEDQSDLEALVAAANDEDGDWSDGMSAVADLNQMTREWAVERYVSHWDGYAGEADDFRPNNYYLHSDDAGIFTMLPWGTDQTWGSGVIDTWIEFDEDAGVLFNRCKADASCWALYEEALEDVYEVVTEGGLEFGRKAAERAELLAASQALELPDRREYDAGEIADGVDRAIAYIIERPKELASYLEVCFVGVVEEAPGFVSEGNCPPPPPGPRVIVDTQPLPTQPIARAQFRRTVRSSARLTTRVALSGPGRLFQRVTAKLGGKAKRICTARARGSAAGTVTLRCRLSKQARVHLRDRSLRVRVRFYFFPSGGERTVKARTLKLPRAR
jgi:hypothetical protein